MAKKRAECQKKGEGQKKNKQITSYCSHHCPSGCQREGRFLRPWQSCDTCGGSTRAPPSRVSGVSQCTSIACSDRAGRWHVRFHHVGKHALLSWLCAALDTPGCLAHWLTALACNDLVPSLRDGGLHSRGASMWGRMWLPVAADNKRRAPWLRSPFRSCLIGCKGRVGSGCVPPLCCTGG